MHYWESQPYVPSVKGVRNITNIYSIIHKANKRVTIIDATRNSGVWILRETESLEPKKKTCINQVTTKIKSFETLRADLMETFMYVEQITNS